MKRTLKILCLLLLICLVGCNEGADVSTDGTADTSTDGTADTSFGDKNTEKTGMRYAERVGNIIFSEAGVVYSDNYVLHFVPIDGGEDMVLCYDPNCEHSREDTLEGKADCMAVCPPTRNSYVGFYEGAIYFFVSTNGEEHQICKMDISSASREIIVDGLPNDPNTDMVCTFCGGKLYYIADILNRDESTSKIYYTKRIIEVDLADGSYRFITEEKDTNISQVNIAGDTLFAYQYDDDGLPYIIKVDLVTLEETMFISKEEWRAGERYINVYDEDSYFYWDKDAGEIGIKNFDKTVERVLVKGPKGERFGATPSCNGIIYRRSIDYEEEPEGCYFMDIETGKVTNITDVADKYNLRQYDGYYDVFIGLNKDGNYILNYTLWSREKILNEANE